MIGLVYQKYISSALTGLLSDRLEFRKDPTNPLGPHVAGLPNLISTSESDYLSRLAIAIANQTIPFIGSPVSGRQANPDSDASWISFEAGRIILDRGLLNYHDDAANPEESKTQATAAAAVRQAILNMLQQDFASMRDWPETAKLEANSFISLTTSMAARNQASTSPQMINCWLRASQRSLLVNWGFSGSELVKYTGQLLKHPPSLVDIPSPAGSAYADTLFLANQAILMYTTNLLNIELHARPDLRPNMEFYRDLVFDLPYGTLGRDCISYARIPIFSQIESHGDATMEPAG